MKTCRLVRIGIIFKEVVKMLFMVLQPYMCALGSCHWFVSDKKIAIYYQFYNYQFYNKNATIISYLRIQLQEAGFQSVSCPISELFQGWLNFVLFNRWLKVNTELVHQRLDLRFHTRDTAVVYFLPAFWFQTIEGRVGFQFFCTCRCVGPAFQRSWSTGCERNLHRRTTDVGNLILRSILRIAGRDRGRLRRTMT